MNAYRKIANEGHEEAGRNTTRCISHHGLSRAQVRMKKAYNRAAKRVEARNAFKDEVKQA